MQKRRVLWLVIAAALILVGCIMFGGVMTMLRWDFTNLSTVKYETNEHEINETYRNISVITDTADLVFLPAEDGKTKVVCHEEEHATHCVTVEEGSLVIEVSDTRKWYEHVGIHFDTPKITVYLPKGEYGGLSVKISTGDVTIPEDFTFESMDVSGNTGHVTSYASASGKVKIKTSTGSIRVENISANALELSVSTGDIAAFKVTCQGDVTVHVSTGKTKLADISCKNLISSGSTGDISLKNVIAAEAFSIDRTTGDVKLDGCDAAQIAVKTNTGDVTGTLLSEKNFIAKTNTGRVDVPKTLTGGKCDITTNTGDIKISISGR